MGVVAGLTQPLHRPQAELAVIPGLVMFRCITECVAECIAAHVQSKPQSSLQDALHKYKCTLRGWCLASIGCAYREDHST